MFCNGYNVLRQEFIFVSSKDVAFVNLTAHDRIKYQLMQVSLYFCISAARERALPKMFLVNQGVQNAKIDLCHAAAILSQEI